MKGLFLQDYMIFKKQTLLWIVLIVLTLLYTFLEMPYFMIGFGTLYLAMFAIKTVLLELEKHTAPFFFTLPFTNFQFVGEKYLVVILFPVFFGLILSFLSIALGQLSLKEGIWSLAMAGVSVLLMSSVMIPLTIRFQDKAVFISMAIMAAFFLALTFMQDSINLSDLAFFKDHLLWFEIGIPIGLFFVLIFSMVLSLKWLKEKEF